MTENLTTGFNSEPSEPNLNLGIKRPLLPHQPLGRKLISPKFLSPLGAKSLSNFDPSIFFNSETTDFNIIDTSFQNSPFFSESKSPHLNNKNLSEVNTVTKNTSNSTIIQHKLDNSNFAPSSDVLLNHDMGRDLLKSEASANTHIPINKTNNAESTIIQPQIDIHDSAASPKIEHLPTTSQPTEHKPSTTGAEATIIQPQLDTHDSVTIPKIEHLPITPQAREYRASTTSAESTTIQPQLDSNDSVTSPKIENLATTSQAT
ncbi:MAG: hypothetical protein KAF91_02140, partial [Nostoc sp. TH1S01]|nr:hypothetical protein [Nostoc sp. TH1S01]